MTLNRDVPPLEGENVSDPEIPKIVKSVWSKIFEKDEALNHAS